MIIHVHVLLTESVENLYPQILMEPQYDRRLFKKNCWHVNVDSVEKYILCAIWRVYIVWSFFAVKSDLPFDMKKIIFKRQYSLKLKLDAIDKKETLSAFQNIFTVFICSWVVLKVIILSSRWDEQECKVTQIPVMFFSSRTQNYLITLIYKPINIRRFNTPYP